MNEVLSGSSASAALLLLGLALVPMALITLTSFAKIAVVLSALRNALGAPDIPSGAVVTALALALSVYVMAPVAGRVEQRLLAMPKTEQANLLAWIGAGREPLSAFLGKHAGASELKLFVELAKERGETALPTDLSVLWPSFAISELKRAFELAFYLFLPFLALDLVVSHVLLALGMQSLDPTRVALPFKLLLFVSVNGFALLSRALVLGY
jgi:flagellar biosynthesis protein FliP